MSAWDWVSAVCVVIVACNVLFVMWMVGRSHRIDARLADPDAKRAAFQAQAEADLDPDDILYLTCVRRGIHVFRPSDHRCLYCGTRRPVDADHARATARRAAATRPPADTHPQNGTHT